MKTSNSIFNRSLSKLVIFILLLSIFPVSAASSAADTKKDGKVKTKPAKKMAMPPMTSTVTNSTAIAIADNQGGAVSNPYPSDITISGLVGKITNVTVTFRNLSIGRPRDLDILLVGPGGQALILMSDTGGTSEPSSTTTNVTITLQDGSPSLPGDFIGTTPLVSGTFRPTNNGAGEANLPAPAPTISVANYPPNSTDANSTPCTGCVETFASIFAKPGVPANGVWRLYVDDDGGGGTVGNMAGGWTLSVTTDGIAPTAASVSVGGKVITNGKRGLANAFVYLTDAEGNIRTAITNSSGYYRFYDISAGQTVTLTVVSKRYQFAPQVINVNEETDGVNFIAD